MCIESIKEIENNSASSSIKSIHIMSRKKVIRFISMFGARQPILPCDVCFVAKFSVSTLQLLLFYSRRKAVCSFWILCRLHTSVCQRLFWLKISLLNKIFFSHFSFFLHSNKWIQLLLEHARVKIPCSGALHTASPLFHQPTISFFFLSLAFSYIQRI